MEDIARGILTGVAIGGFAALIFNANLFAVKTLWRFNRLAIQTACEMKLGFITGDVLRKIRIEQRGVAEPQRESES